MADRGRSRQGPRIVVAMDAFKGTLSSLEAGRGLAAGITAAHPDGTVTVLCLSDGGEGFLDALAGPLGCVIETATVTDPLGRPVQARWGRGETAVVEMAAASGLTLLQPPERNPLRASSRGTGELLANALERGATSVLLGVGGSATVDGGTGALRALGFGFHDARGRPLPEGGGALVDLAGIDAAPREKLSSVQWTVATDVTHPLLGPDGAAAVFGPQKGAGPGDVTRLEAGLARLSLCLEKFSGPNPAQLPRGGAAGGLPAAFSALLGAARVSGADLVLDLVGFDDLVMDADLVITGEGRLDTQTTGGKLVDRVVARARGRGCPVSVVAGSVASGATALHGVSILTVTDGTEQDPERLRSLSLEALPGLGVRAVSAILDGDAS